MKKVFIVLLSLFMITGCGNNEPKDNVVTPETSSDNVAIEKVDIIDLESNSRPYAVVINNYPSAVKVQTGLSDAYMVYEIPVEGGMSRSLAFYKDKTTNKIGTVRSARHNFLDYVMENDAIFAHFGWSHYAMDQIPQLGIDNLDGNWSDTGAFWRENPENLAWEHTAYGSLEKIIARSKEKGYRQTSDKKALLNYSATEINIDTKNDVIVANNVVVPYSDYYKTKFIYNKDNNRYYRYVNGVAHTDYFTKEHYSTKNIIVVKVDYTYTDDNYYLDIKNVGKGNGYYITNGYAVPIIWQKDSRSAQTVYKYLDNTEIDVNDGNTYIMLQAASYSTVIE